MSRRNGVKVHTSATILALLYVQVIGKACVNHLLYNNMIGKERYFARWMDNCLQLFYISTTYSEKEQMMALNEVNTFHFEINQFRDTDYLREDTRSLLIESGPL